jgi:outer membrane protein assembly factor BamB
MANMAGGSRMRKWSVKLAVLLGAVVLVLVYLVKFQGLRVERDGTGWKPMFSFYQPEKHLAEIEKNRATAAVVAPASIPAPVVDPGAAARPEPAPEVDSAAKEPVPAAKPFWTDFRGPRRDGIYDEMPVQTKWPAQGPQRLWKKPIGGGYASFVIAEGRAYTIEQRRNQEVVSAYDLATGQEVWSHAWEAYFRESMGGDGPRATPTWHEGHIYALGAEGELRCLDARNGRRIWSKNILTENGADNLTWGMSAAPLIVDDKVIVLPGGQDGRSVVAYDKLTGAPVWSSLDDKQAYTSPILATLAGQRQIVVVSARRAMGLSVDKGALLWEYPWVTSFDVNASQPVIVDGERLILSAGYDHGAALVKIARSGNDFSAQKVWENRRMKNKFTSSVLHDGYIYGLDESILACVNAETGELKWKGGRYGFGQVMLASGHLIVSAENGDLALVRATPDQHQELVRFSAIEGKTWNHPAAAHGILLVRNQVEMAAFRIGR